MLNFKFYIHLKNITNYINNDAAIRYNRIINKNFSEL